MWIQKIFSLLKCYILLFFRIILVFVQALFRANPSVFDLVVTDMTMPNMTGDQFAKKLMEIKPDIPIIICTGFSVKINKSKAESIGIKGLLMKPVVMSKLANMIRKVMDEAKILAQ